MWFRSQGVLVTEALSMIVGRLASHLVVFGACMAACWSVALVHPPILQLLVRCVVFHCWYKGCSECS